MKRADYQKALVALKDEGDRLYEESILDRKTAEYLSNRIDEIIKREDVPNMTFDERETLLKELFSLEGKLVFEQRKLEISDKKGEDFTRRLKALMLLETSGLIEG